MTGIAFAEILRSSGKVVLAAVVSLELSIWFVIHNKPLIQITLSICIGYKFRQFHIQDFGLAGHWISQSVCRGHSFVCWYFESGIEDLCQMPNTLTNIIQSNCQLILAYGIRKSIQLPNEEHPYGYHSARYIASLVSGVGIFCVGTGLSVYHGIDGLIHPGTMEPLYWVKWRDIKSMFRIYYIYKCFQL